MGRLRGRAYHDRRKRPPTRAAPETSMSRHLLCWAALLLLAARASAAAPPRPDVHLGKGLDDLVTAVMKEYDVPGLGLAVVKDGKILLAKGYGFRDVEKQLPVTGRTL